MRGCCKKVAAGWIRLSGCDLRFELGEDAGIAGADVGGLRGLGETGELGWRGLEFEGEMLPVVLQFVEAPVGVDGLPGTGAGGGEDEVSGVDRAVVGLEAAVE